MEQKIIWDDVTISRKKTRITSLQPIASIMENRIIFNSAACQLIENIYGYRVAKVQVGRRDREIIKIAFIFLMESDKDCLRVARRKYKGKLAEGVVFYCKDLVSRYFSLSDEKKTLRFPVEKMNGNTLVIDIEKELNE